MEGPEERQKGFKGVEGNIEGGEGGRMSGSSGKWEVSEEQDWADPQLPTEVPINSSLVMPARKQAEVSRTYSHMSSRRGFQLIEKLHWEKQNQKEKIESSKEPGGKNSQPRTQGLNPHLTKRARKKFSSPGSQKWISIWNKEPSPELREWMNLTQNKEPERKPYSPVCITHSHAQLLANPWAGAHQAPLSMGFPRQEYLSGLPFPSPGTLPNPGIKAASPVLALVFLTTEPNGNMQERSSWAWLLQLTFVDPPHCCEFSLLCGMTRVDRPWFTYPFYYGCTLEWFSVLGLNTAWDNSRTCLWWTHYS